MTGVVAFIFPRRRAKEWAEVICSLVSLRYSARIFFNLSNGSLSSMDTVSTIRPRNSRICAGFAIDFFAFQQVYQGHYMPL